MKIKPVLTILLTATCFTAGARPKPANGGSKIGIISATSQRTLPGRKEMQPVTNYRIIAVWKSKRAPGSFYWQAADGTWMNCRIALAHKKATVREDYTTTAVDAAQVHCGDTLEISPIPGETVQPPLTAQKTNTLFFTSPAGKWWYITAPKISRQPDIIMP